MRRALLEEGLARFGIDDPEHRLAVSLATYARDAIERGLAVFGAKRDAGTLPPDAEPGRYLGGIIRNISARLDLEAIATHLLAIRLRARDLSLAPLVQAAERIRVEHPAAERPRVELDRAPDASPLLDSRLWRDQAASSLAALGPDQARAMLPALTRRVTACFEAPVDRRADLIAALTAAAAA